MTAKLPNILGIVKEGITCRRLTPLECAFRTLEQKNKLKSFYQKQNDKGNGVSGNNKRKSLQVARIYLRGEDCQGHEE